MELLIFLIVLAVVAVGSIATIFIFKERYFAGEEFQAHKTRIASVVAEHNDVANYVAEIRAGGSFTVGSSNTGAQAHLATFQNTSHWNYRRDRNIANYHAPNVHNCSLQVVRNASADPLKYVMKYFGIKADEANLADVEKLGDDITRLETAISNLKRREDSITTSVSPPAFILKFFEREFMQHIGVQLSPISVPYPTYRFEYVSAGGNSSQQASVTLDTDTIDVFVETLSQKIRWKKSAAGQRALMTSKLRNSIKQRDNYACKYCSASIAKEPNLLLEIDHIVPVSRGGLSHPDNLQTLCWRCNRKKSNKLIPNGSPKSDVPVTAYTTIRCFNCQNTQKVDKTLTSFNCAQCGQNLKRKVATAT